MVETLAAAAIAGAVAGIWRLTVQVGKIVVHISAMRKEMAKDVESIKTTLNNHKEHVETEFDHQRDVIEETKEHIKDHEQRIRVLEKLS